jgi:proteasome lid subunit RPN8/RPN11
MSIFGLTSLPGAAPAELRLAGLCKIRLSVEAWTTVAAAAATAHPLECCGALVGEVADGEVRVLAAWPARNVAAEPWRRYEIAAREVRELDTRARVAGLHVVGYYHSHPDREPEPSPTDLELALPGLVYLIASATQADAGPARAWRLEEDRSGFREEELIIGPE